MTVMTLTTGKIYSNDSDDSNESDDSMTATTSNVRYPVMTGTTSDITWPLCIEKIKKNTTDPWETYWTPTYPNRPQQTPTNPNITQLNPEYKLNGTYNF